MTLSEQVHIARRFLKSVRIDTDLGSPRALEGFVCPQSSAEVLLTMANHVAENQQGAFTWTGPYGSGKSSLIVALSALLSGDSELQQAATRIFGSKLTHTLASALPTGPKGWRMIPVVARRDDPVAVIGEGIQAAGLVSRKPRGGWTESNLITTLTEAAANKDHGGLILFIDELGKFLEAAALQGADIYILQQLAEAASRSNGRLILVGVLHQAFEQYAQRLPQEMRDEWSKIQGRFVDLAVNASGAEQIDLISRAIESDHCSDKPSALATTVATFANRAADQLAIRLEGCWPLHPVVPCLIGPISRRRYGQNQRSLFGFLNASEMHGFQDFLRHTEDGLYMPARLWDYLQVNLEASILASPEGHRWALAAEALARCDANGGDALQLQLLKTIALLDLFKDRSGLVARFEVLHACFPECSAEALELALSLLVSGSYTIYKKFLGAYALFAGSDFDIELAVRSALDETGEMDFKELKALASLQPILAKRHYHETGSQRWFDVELIPVHDLSGTPFKPNNGAIGQFLLAIPEQGEEHAQERCQTATLSSTEWDTVVGLAQRSDMLATLTRELAALNKVRNDHPELAGDAVARREVAARLADVQALLEGELKKAFDDALWFRKHHQPMQIQLADRNSLASELADRRFAQCPLLHNELLNRQKPSGSAIAAQNILLRRMVQNAGEPRLGIEGFPAEGGLLVSLLVATGLYAQVDKEWRFVPPLAGLDRQRLAPLWAEALEHVKQQAHRTVTIPELYERWRRPPFGVKEGLMPILAVAFLLSHQNELAIYRDGCFCVRFDAVAVAYLAKEAATIQLRWMALTDFARQLLAAMVELVRDLGDSPELASPNALDIARALVAIYECIPPWTKRTLQLTANGARVRDLFKRANDPNRFLFDDLPSLLGSGHSNDPNKRLASLVTLVREGLEELVQAYPAMLQRMSDRMLGELRVPNRTPQAMAELRARAVNIQKLAGDFRLDALVGRLAQFDGSTERFEGIASLAADKPPQQWVDLDLDRAAMELAEMSQKFLRVETFTRVKGRPAKRQAMSVVVGRNGQPVPLTAEFTVADSERDRVDQLIERIVETLEVTGTHQHHIILAALAEASTRYMKGEVPAEPVLEGAS